MDGAPIRRLLVPLQRTPVRLLEMSPNFPLADRGTGDLGWRPIVPATLMLLPIVFLVIGTVLLVFSADFLVKGASRLAAAVGISPLVIGLTVVAFGTSAPELAVSVMSAFRGQADLALGNVIGSNIFNVLMILGLAALVTPLVVAKQLVRLDVPVMIAASFLILWAGMDGRISRLEGIGLFALALLYTTFLIRQSRRESATVAAAKAHELEQELGLEVVDETPIWKDVGAIALGIAGLVFGAKFLVDGAVDIARMLGVSELIIGLTIVAAGTSLPEAATSVVAAMRGERDIAVGNAVGSNIFNILVVLGLASVVAPAGIAVNAEAQRFDIPFMILVAITCLPVFLKSYRIGRWNGAAFIGAYLLYLADLIFTSKDCSFAGEFHSILELVIAPLIGIVLLWMLFRGLTRKPASEAERLPGTSPPQD